VSDFAKRAGHEVVALDNGGELRILLDQLK